MNLSALKNATNQTAPRTSGISSLMEIEISKIYPNPDQPRKHFDPVSLLELAESIKTKGLLQPISVVRKSDKYMIIAGQRRYESSKINGAITIKSIVFDSDDHSVDEMALIENIQREDLTDYETSMAIVRLWESGKYTQKQELAGAIGKPLSYVSKAFGCFKLDPMIKADIEANKRDIGLSVLEELSRVKDPEKQREIYQRYNSGEIKRDDFKEAAKPKVEKVYQGKKVVKQLKKSGHALMSYEIYREFRDLGVLLADKQYKVTIEEI